MHGLEAARSEHLFATPLLTHIRAGVCYADPNRARTNAFFPELSASDVLYQPEPGLMILFPSHVPHAVPPHRGPRPRISIAFNARREPFP